jgi:hypothetical protein
MHDDRAGATARDTPPARRSVSRAYRLCGRATGQFDGGSSRDRPQVREIPGGQRRLQRRRIQRGTGVASIARSPEGVHVPSHRQTSIAIVVTSFLVACASKPTGQLGESEAAYRAAEEVGARNQPEAAYHLKLAHEQIVAAKKLMDGNKKDKRHARDLLEQAELDAEVAISTAKTSEAKARAKQAWVKVNELKTQDAIKSE